MVNWSFSLSVSISRYSVSLLTWYWFSFPPPLPSLKSVLTTIPPVCFHILSFYYLSSSLELFSRPSLTPQSFAHPWKPAGAFALVRFLWKLGFCESLLRVNRSCTQTPKWLQNLSRLSFDLLFQHFLPRLTTFDSSLLSRGLLL